MEEAIAGGWPLAEVAVLLGWHFVDVGEGGEGWFDTGHSPASWAARIPAETGQRNAIVSRGWLSSHLRDLLGLV